MMGMPDVDPSLMQEAVTGAAPEIVQGFPVVTPIMKTLALNTPASRFVAVTTIGSALTLVWRPKRFFDENGDLREESRYTAFLPALAAGVAVALFA